MPSTLGNPTSNETLERIHQVMGILVQKYNITETYIDNDYLLLGIVLAEESTISSTENRLKGYSPGKLVFVCDIILPIIHTVD